MTLKSANYPVSEHFQFMAADPHSRASMVLDRSIVTALLAALAFTAFAHGAVEPWSVALLELIVIGFLLMWAVKATADHRLEVVIPAATLPIAALVLLGIAQSVSLSNNAGQRVSLSVDVEATRQVLIVLFCLAISFLAAANFLVSRERLLLVANFLTVFGATVAAFALIQHFTWDGRFYWWRATEYTVFGPFVSRNHFAGYMTLLIPLPLALIVRAIRGQVRLVYGFAAALMGIAVVVSGSRSGIISLIVAMIALAVLNQQSHRSLQRHAGSQAGRLRFLKTGPIFIIALVVIAGGLWIDGANIVQRFGVAVDAFLRSGTPDVSRAVIWQDTLKMIRDYPILGTGLGSYATAYPSYASSEKLFFLDYAHNDYLQVLANTGVVGGLIAAWFVIVICSSIYRGIRSRDRVVGALALAAGAAMFAVGVQSLSDTNLQIPSNALVFLVLAAVVSRAETPSSLPRRKGGGKRCSEIPVGCSPETYIFVEKE